jgi:DNA-binding SARP family transcriptional activator
LNSSAGEREHHHPVTHTLDRRGNVTVRLLGGFELLIDGQPVHIVERCQKVIAYLALAGAPQESSVLAARLWPDSNDVRAGANLRAARWREPNTGSSQVTKIHGARVQLCDDAHVDVRELETTGWSLIQGRPPSTDFDKSYLFMDLLPGWYDDWVIVERERLSQLQLRFAEAYACRVLRHGSTIEAMDVALRLVAADPYREASHRLLVATYLLDGSPHQAQSHIDRHRQQILEELGQHTTLTLAAVRDWVSVEMRID